MALFVALALALFFLALIALLVAGRGLPKREHEADIAALEKRLPQTQCGACGFAGCRPYAAAVLRGEADINRCLPGGQETVLDLADLLGREVKPLYRPAGKYGTARLAVIDEAQCIGCAKCIVACPVAAIVGAPKQMHSIIDQDCTGCELCVAPCPVDCISMRARP